MNYLEGRIFSYILDLSVFSFKIAAKSSYTITKLLTKFIYQFSKYSLNFLSNGPKYLEVLQQIQNQIEEKQKKGKLKNQKTQSIFRIF